MIGISGDTSVTVTSVQREEGDVPVSPAAKLCGFLLLLAVIFIGAYAAGAHLGPVTVGSPSSGTSSPGPANPGGGGTGGGGMGGSMNMGGP